MYVGKEMNTIDEVSWTYSKNKESIFSQYIIVEMIIIYYTDGLMWHS